MAGKTIQNNTLHHKLEQESFLPIANVSRIMKKSLPPNAKISKDAKETVQQCVSEFISFVTGEASDKCQREKRKTINGDDLLWAMTTLGFKNYVGPLKVYLNKCNGDIQTEKSEEDDCSQANDMISGDYETIRGGLATKIDHLQDFNRGNYLVSLGLSQMSPNMSQSVISYGENSVSTYGVEW